MDILNTDVPDTELSCWPPGKSSLVPSVTVRRWKGLIQLIDMSCLDPAAGPVLGRSFRGKIISTKPRGNAEQLLICKTFTYFRSS